MPSHFDALQRPGPVGLRRVAGVLHSVAKQAWFCVALRSDFGGFGRPKWMPKFDFWVFFFDVILQCVFASIFVCFFEPPDLKNSNFA